VKVVIIYPELYYTDNVEKYAKNIERDKKIDCEHSA